MDVLYQLVNSFLGSAFSVSFGSAFGIVFGAVTGLACALVVVIAIILLASCILGGVGKLLLYMETMKS